MKNVILLNNRSLHLYDFKELKKDYDLRISVVVFESSYKNLSSDIKENLDKIHVLPDVKYDAQNFPSFPKDFLCSLIEEELIRYKETWLVASEELDVSVVSHLRDKYKLPGSSNSIISNYTNKVVQKKVLLQSKIRIPKFVSIPKKIEKTEIVYNDFVREINCPFVLKPIDMGGTIGVEKIESYEKFIDYFSKFTHFSDFIAEEFIDGQLYHCDLIIQNGLYYFAEVSEYLWNGLSFLKGKNHGSFILEENDPLKIKIIDFCKKANLSLGLTTGTAHFEVFVTKQQEIVFLEAAARPAGSMVPLVYTKMFKRNYLNNALLVEIQENIQLFQSPNKYYFWIIFPRKAGIVKELKIPLIKSLYEIEWYVKENDEISFSSSIAEKSGTLLAYNKCYKVLKKDFQLFKYFDTIKII